MWKSKIKYVILLYIFVFHACEMLVKYIEVYPLHERFMLSSEGTNFDTC